MTRRDHAPDSQEDLSTRDGHVYCSTLTGKENLTSEPVEATNSHAQGIVHEPRSSSIVESFNSLRHPEYGSMHTGGLAYRQLHVSQSCSTTEHQLSFLRHPLMLIGALFRSRRKVQKSILCDLEGLVESGQMLLVLGIPGSGCDTLLKTLAGRVDGLSIDEKSILNYQGHSWNEIRCEYRDQCTYEAESDTHFPQLTVAQTLAFASEARTPYTTSQRRGGRKLLARQRTDATLATLGLSSAVTTKVGNDFVPGISGGERKRLSIAELLVSGAAIQCWDNSTRGLDSGNAKQFLRVLRSSTTENGSVALVSLNQASEDMFDIFDNVVLLYEGRQIFFGLTSTAKTYFSKLGFECLHGLTTSDFLTSMTNPAQRIIRHGMESRAPSTAVQFAQLWRDSEERTSLLSKIENYERENPVGITNSKKQQQSKSFGLARGPRLRSPFMLTTKDEISLCIRRGFQRLANDLAPPLSSIFGNAIVSIILGSIFYNLPENTGSFYGRGVLLFFTVLTNTFLGAFEGVQLWEHRPIVEKQSAYAFYHPATEAVSSMICDLPNKLLLTTLFNVPFYFLANMRRTPAAFFTFYVFAFSSLLTGSMLFRVIGAMSRTLIASIAPGADFILLLVIYTGFVVPIPSMHPWLRWFNYINPVGYAFESLMINEFSGRSFSCSDFVPHGANYSHIGATEQSCAAVGADTGSTFVDGEKYVAVSYHYRADHLWRNLGIVFAFMIFLCGTYLVATEYVSSSPSKGEVLVFQRSHKDTHTNQTDVEAQNLQQTSHMIAKRNSSRSVSMHDKNHGATFLWDGLCYDVKVRDGSRRLLEKIDGWVKPGTVTALMGASGAGKTTLLNVLADRASTGVVSGGKLIDAAYEKGGSARNVGYAQQQDFHHTSSTVREALIFSACLRKSEKYSRAENLAYVDEVIENLDMVEFADAIIGIPGAGLNVEQRKRLTIGVELAARPELLLFLDEPTSGLDSNTAWSICALLRKLADNGHSILCTIHQPSRSLFQMFDRLLLLDKGRCIYFGDIGSDSAIVTKYFEDRGAGKCGEENPADWFMDITNGSLPQGKQVNWAEKWSLSAEHISIRETVESMRKDLLKPVATTEVASQEFASTFTYQLYMVVKRNFVHDWRTPSYLYSKILLTLGAVCIIHESFGALADKL